MGKVWVRREKEGDIKFWLRDLCFMSHGHQLYFVNSKGTVSRFDISLLIRAAENKRGYRADNLPTGTVVDFLVVDKAKVIGLNEIGGITITEGGRVVRQIAKSKQGGVFYTCISEGEDRYITTQYDHPRTTKTLIPKN
jgi:hypothetical protein